MSSKSDFRFGEDRRDGPIVRFEHPAPPLDVVSDAFASTACLFDPAKCSSGHWIEADIDAFVPAEVAR